MKAGDQRNSTTIAADARLMLMSNTRKTRGFSLIEVTVVAAIILIVAAIAIPMVRGVVASYRVSTAAKSVAYELMMARFRAVSSFTLARLNCDSAALVCVVESCTTKTTAGALCTAWTADGGNYPLPSNVTFGAGSISSAPPNSQAALAQTYQITFNSRGLAVDISGTAQVPTANYALYLRDATRSDNEGIYAVTVSPVGAVNVYRYTSGGWSHR